jgi:hypothetical protein
VHRGQDAVGIGRLGPGAGERRPGQLDLDLEADGAKARQLLGVIFSRGDLGGDPRRRAPRLDHALEVVDPIEAEPAAERLRLGRHVGVELAGRSVLRLLGAKPVRLDGRPLDARLTERLGRERLPAERDLRDPGRREHRAAPAAMTHDDRGELGVLIDARLGRGITPCAVVDATDNDRAVGDQLGRRRGDRRHQAGEHAEPRRPASQAHPSGMIDRARRGKQNDPARSRVLTDRGRRLVPAR